MNDRHDHWIRKEIKRKRNNYFFFYKRVTLFMGVLVIYIIIASELGMNLIMFCL